MFEEKPESTNGETFLPTAKETEKDVDKACLSISRTASFLHSDQNKYKTYIILKLISNTNSDFRSCF